MSMINGSSEEQLDQGKTMNQNEHEDSTRQILDNNTNPVDHEQAVQRIITGEEPRSSYLSRLFRSLLHNLQVSIPRWDMLMTSYVEAKLPEADLETRQALRSNLTQTLGQAKLSADSFVKGLQMLGVHSATIEMRCELADGTLTSVRTPVIFNGHVMDSGAKYMYEIQPCCYEPDTAPNDARRGVVACEESQAQFWGVYRRPVEADAQGNHLAEWVIDRATKAEAEAQVTALRQADFGQ